MALEARIVTAFNLGDRTPASILWEGVVAVENPDRKTEKGYNELVFKGQVKLVQGANGQFIGSPSRKSADGRYFNYFDLGPSMQRLILPVVQAAVEERSDTSTGDVTTEAADAFADLPF